MQSSARVIDAERRSATALAAIALTALALSLLLAFVSTLHRQPGAAVQRTTTVSPAVTPRAAGAVTPAPPAAAVAEPASPAKPQPLDELLVPWALTADALAVVGLAAVLALRHAARHRGARP